MEAIDTTRLYSGVEAAAALDISLGELNCLIRDGLLAVVTQGGNRGIAGGTLLVEQQYRRTASPFGLTLRTAWEEYARLP